MTVYTVGHSTRPLEEFIALLRLFAVEEVLDVRHFPRSRHNPQYNSETLGPALLAGGIEYRAVPQLGGRRPHRPNSLNLAWQNESFRAYADFMSEPEFGEGLRIVLDEARVKQVCLMCAEALPWRCHRRLIADALLAQGVRVEHLLDERTQREHVLTPWAQVQDGRVSYP